MTRIRAREVTPDRVVFDDGRQIHTENVIWTAGNRPNAKLKDLDLPLTRRDGLISESTCECRTGPMSGYR
jgi:NADH dehydrogenase